MTQTDPGALPVRDRQTILLALGLARKFLDSLIDGEADAGGRIAPEHPLGATFRRWQQQRRRIADCEARLARKKAKRS